MVYDDSDKIYLQIENNTLPVEPSKGYTLNLSDSDRKDTTEAGTTIREVTRLNIPSISVTLECDVAMLKELRRYKSKSSVSVKYFDPMAEGDLKNAVMYLDGYKETMLADTEDGGFWKVEFSLEDLSDV